MAGLAVLLRAEGSRVSGCDLHESPRTKWLRDLGIEVMIGHDPAHVVGMDEVIVTPAVPEDSEEFQRARAYSSFSYRGDVLSRIVSSRESIAVCGSHGKTTTSTWIARLLLALGEDVAWCIGGETGDFPVAGTGSGVLVVEADESDGTLARYRASTLVVNRLEYDHPDHFKTESDYFACFDCARKQAKDVIESENLAPLAFLEDLPAFAALPTHNRKNARAAVEVALRRGHEPAALARALPSILAALPDRRFESLAPGIYTDYAHHPTEMACAVSMARAVCRGTLRVLFQPHRYSRTKALLESFPQSFVGADEVILCPTYAAFEPPLEGGSSADLYAACRRAELSRPARFFLARSCLEAYEHAALSFRPGDVTLVLGAGDIIALREVIAENRAFPPRRVFIGSGSNTWQSDLKLNIEYVQGRGRAAESGASLVAAHPELCPWMAGIPGTIGGWIKMNAGAFGHAFSEVLSAVCVDGQWKTVEECGFSYRKSEIHGEITDYRLRTDLPPANESPRDYLARRKVFPAGTYGSFFKNPPNDFAGRLLESVDAKTLSVGGAYVWSEHANVIVRGEGASLSDVLALAEIMRNRVKLRCGVTLEPEVCGISS